MRFLRLTLLIGLLLLPGITHAHPGRTDSKGGHVCRTNCAKWGVADGAWHDHGAPNTSIPPSGEAPKPKAEKKAKTQSAAAAPKQAKKKSK